MERREPSLAPEWLKAASGGFGSSNSNQLVGSSTHSDDHAVGIQLKNRLSGSACDHDNTRNLAPIDRLTNSSFRRSASSNGSMSHDKDGSTHSRPYSSFGRSNRDRDREKDLDPRDRERFLLPDNGYRDFSNSFMTVRSEKDALRRSQSMVSGRRVEQLPKRPAGIDTNNGILSSGSMVSSIHKASFERDFPSLGSEEKQGPPNVGRVSSPGLCTSVQSLPLVSSNIGTEGWSVLAKIPVIAGGNGPIPTPVQHSVPANLVSTASSTISGLNMAETVAQAPLRARAVPQLSTENQRLEELALKQSRQLIPVTPSMPKASALNSSEKSKPKGSRSGDLSILPKLGQQSPSQLLKGSSGLEISKGSQAGKFQVLNREKNGVSPGIKDGPPANASRVVNTHGVVPSAAVGPLKSPNSLKPKLDGKTVGTQSSVVEKKPSSQAQNRNDFFNSLRKKTSTNHSSATPDSRAAVFSNLDRTEELSQVDSSTAIGKAEDTAASNCGSHSSMVNGDEESENCYAGEEPKSSPPHQEEPLSSCSDPVDEPDEEEERFLLSLGWEKGAGEEALTAEEIDAFVKKYNMMKPCEVPAQFKNGLLEGDAAFSGLSLPDSSEKEA